jgi:FemAB-related protein (PEP-CTERM system-associated)
VDIRPHEENGQSWDRFIRSCEGWTHSHLYGWKSVIEATFGHESLYLVARENDQIAGVLPLVHVKSRLFGHYLVSMPFLNYGGPLGSTRAITALVDEASRVAAGSGVSLLELRSRRRLALDLPASHRKITVVRQLFGDPDRLWADLRSKTRTRVRRPQKQGIRVRFGPAEASAFHRVFSRHMRDLGTPTLPMRFFARIRETFGDSVWFGTAYLGGEPIAAGCALRWQDEVEMTWSSTLSSHRRHGTNMLLFWEFMKRGASEGLSLFNFGRSTPGTGTHEFKRQWGSRDEQLWWYYRTDGEREKTPSPDDDSYAWGPRIWRRLPVALTRVIGPRIVRYIP